MQRPNYVPVCDGCGLAAAPEAHIQRRIKRIELATRYRPIHIQTLFLALAPPQAMEDFFYSSSPSTGGRSPAGRQFLTDTLVQSGLSGVVANDAALEEFQRHNFYLAYVLECPVSEAYPDDDSTTHGDTSVAGTIIRDHTATLLRRMQFSYRPKQVATVGSIPELVERLWGSGVEIVS